jgi:hypothetical protein
MYSEFFPWNNSDILLDFFLRNMLEFFLSQLLGRSVSSETENPKILRARAFFFIAIRILEQFYNAKKKKKFLLIFEAIFRFLFVKVFLNIKTPHMHKYILAIQNLLVVICISYTNRTT